jgi:hypothetical protein
VTPVPSRLEYGYGFDLAAGWLGGAAYPLLAVVSAPEFVDHVASRAEGPVVFACDDARTGDYARRRLTGGEVPPEVGQRSRVWSPADGPEGEAGWGTRGGSDGGRRTADGGPPPVFGSVIWAAPQPGTWPARLAAIGRLLGPGGQVCVFTGTGLDGLTGLLRVRGAPGGPAPLDRRLRRGLAAAGWRVTRSRGLGGLASVGWAVAGRLAVLARRPDLADRAERAHHLAVEGGAGASYALLLATREASAGPPAAIREGVPGVLAGEGGGG